MHKFKTNKLLTISILTIILFSIGVFSFKNNISLAGSLNNALSPASTLYTLTDIYNRLISNTPATVGNHNLGPSANPASTNYTLTEIYNAIPTIDATKVLFGTSYLGVAGTATTTVTTLCYDNSNYHNTMSNCLNSQGCDSSFNGTYTADGIVVNEGTCETGDVCFHTPNYYSNMSSCVNNDPCDSDVAPTYTANGLICSAVCVVDGSIANDGACCNDLNCTSGDCTGEVCVVSAVCGDGVVTSPEECECGVGGWPGNIGDTNCTVNMPWMDCINCIIHPNM